MIPRLAIFLLLLLGIPALAGPAAMLGAGAGSSGGGGSLSCSYTPNLSATYNVAYTGATPSPSGGTSPYSYTVTGTLPTGMTMSSGTGIITGTDSTDSGGDVYSGIQVVLHDNVSATANCGSSFTITVAAGGGSYVGLCDTAVSGGGCANYWGLRAASAA